MREKPKAPTRPPVASSCLTNPNTRVSTSNEANEEIQAGRSYNVFTHVHLSAKKYIMTSRYR